MGVSDIIRQCEKICILNISLSGAGFETVTLFALCQLRYCEHPVVNYDTEWDNLTNKPA